MANTHKHYEIDRAFLRAIKPTGNWQEFSDSVLRGFAVKVTPTGTVAFTYRWRKPDGTPARKTIGHFPALQPAEARELARKESSVLDHKGGTITRLAERKRKRKRTEVQKVVGVPTVLRFLTDSYEPFLLANREGASSAPRMIRKTFAELLDKPMDEVTRGTSRNGAVNATSAASKLERLTDIWAHCVDCFHGPSSGRSSALTH